MNLGRLRMLPILFRGQRAILVSKPVSSLSNLFLSSAAGNQPYSDVDMPVSMKNPFEKDKQECILCKLKITPNFKNIKLLSQFVSPYTGQIYGRHITGLCRHKQHQIETEINKAQRAGFMAIALKELVFMRDPKLFDPDRPFRPHKY